MFTMQAQVPTCQSTSCSPCRHRPFGCDRCQHTAGQAARDLKSWTAQLTQLLLPLPSKQGVGGWVITATQRGKGGQCDATYAHPEHGELKSLAAVARVLGLPVAAAQQAINAVRASNAAAAAQLSSAPQQQAVQPSTGAGQAARGSSVLPHASGSVKPAAEGRAVPEAAQEQLRHSSRHGTTATSTPAPPPAARKATGGEPLSLFMDPVTGYIFIDAE